MDGHAYATPLPGAHLQDRQASGAWQLPGAYPNPDPAPGAPSLLSHFLAAPADRPCVTMWHGVEATERLTFGELAERAAGVASWLATQGVTVGDRVALILPQGLPLLAAFLGAMWLGAIPAILAYPNFKTNPAKYSAGLAGVRRNLQARLAVVDAAFPHPLPDSARLPDLAALALPSPSSAPPPHQAAPTDIAFIQHSSGATGLQKGVALTHQAVLTQLAHLAEALDIPITLHHSAPADRVYSWLPLYHDMGLIACFLGPLVYHLEVVMQSPTSWVMQPISMLQLITHHRCTLAWLPNFAFAFLAGRALRQRPAGLDLSSLRVLTNCSEPVQPAAMQAFYTTFAPYGLRRDALHTSYALAENVFAVTHSYPTHAPSSPLWVDGDQWRQAHIAVPVAADHPQALALLDSGVCLTGNQVRIVDAAGQTLPPGHVGEILIHSDSLFTGYYNRPDLTQPVWDGVWYRTGDLGMCWEGRLVVTGRRHDLIIVAGKNIYPQDIEEIVGAHPAIHAGRAVALGFFNPDKGTEEIVVVAELEDGCQMSDALEIEMALRQAVLAELDVALKAVYLKPRHWLVKSTAGKPARADTRARLLQEMPYHGLDR